jgi:HAD superfamily phosphoserine phosphatase-like hydrolase
MDHPAGLAVFDLDGTLLRGRTVCEVLAKKLGQTARMREIEALTSEPQIRKAREEMARWYSSVQPSVLIECLSNATLASGAMEGTQRLRKAGIAVAIASITWEFAVEEFARFFKAEFFLGTRLRPNGTIRHCWPRDKALFAVRTQRKLGLNKSRIAAVGDTANDLPMLRAAGLPIFVGKKPPSRLLRIVHMPNASIDDIARYIAAAWR